MQNQPFIMDEDFVDELHEEGAFEIVELHQEFDEIQGNGFVMIQPRFRSLAESGIINSDLLFEKILKKHRITSEEQLILLLLIETEKYSTRFHDRLKE